MKHVIDAITSSLTIFKRADVAFNERKFLPLLWTVHGFDFVKVMLVAGGKVVQTNNELVQFQKVFHKVRNDETGNTCYQSGFRGFV